MLHHYTDIISPFHGQWTKCSIQAAVTSGKGTYAARRIRKMTRAFILDGHLPNNPYGVWNKSRLETDEELKSDITTHLQSLGKYIRAMDLVHYLDLPEVKEKYGVEKTISLATAKRWMKVIGYRWCKTGLKGMYADGHERDDVVFYRQNVFLP
ncbi:hypothetical protein C8J56DRAFT_787552, partial [Mycena floridula]